MPQFRNLLLKVRRVKTIGQKKSVAVTGRLEVALFIQTHCFHGYLPKKQFLRKFLIGNYCWLSNKHFPVSAKCIILRTVTRKTLGQLDV